MSWKDYFYSLINTMISALLGLSKIQRRLDVNMKVCIKCGYEDPVMERCTACGANVEKIRSKPKKKKKNPEKEEIEE